MIKRDRYIILSILLISFFCLFSTQEAFGQDYDQVNKPTLAWINLGYGVSVSEDLSGLGLITHVQYDSEIGLVGLRYFIASDISVHTSFSDYIHEVSEMSITYGYSHNFGILNLSASAGMGALWGEERVSGADNNFSAISFPVLGSIILQPAPFIGLGGMLSASLHSQSTIAGAHFIIQLGRFR